MKLAVFLLTLVATTGAAIALGIYAEFGALKTTAFAICVWFVTQMAYVVFVGILTATSRGLSKEPVPNVRDISVNGPPTQKD
ncbi:hypothetical protein PARPLA_03351 [Rhodobacteraceae bacterium THAF1]|uniref:hypothetical protein n=1 Tax=Palleronia sp. THAF1 TaxID=2587842 RepID=UPI000F3FB0D3|nr:hypothetical protein [Palleronia sp. THAF1]QFU10363.1 hypothetical protein FIU81_16900 [Palleronia sp. THAF1]VDC31482.1 hypothetical protein PARPLA_03351 [Rhodobacteraceae bacterium THAF1]